MRWVEIALLCVPFGLAIAWMCGVRGLSRRGMIAAGLGLGLLGLALFLFGEARAVHGRYVPAHVVDGRVIPGHGG